MNNGNPNTNSGGLTYIPAISTGALYVNNKRLRDIILELQSSISLNQDQITGINAFLARLDLQITDPNILTLTNDNRNQILKQLIDLLNTKTLYLDTTALTQSWVLTDTNRNATLKTRIDGHDTSLGLLNTKTQYITSVQGNNSTNPKTKSTCLIEVYDRDENRILLNTGALNYLSINSFSDSSQNTAILCNAIGVAQIVGKNVKITPFNSSDNIDIGNINNTSNTGQINIGGSLSKINIGSYEDPIFATTIGALGYNDNTIITIGKRTTSKNTLTYLNGNINTGDSRFISLNVTDVVTWETLASWFSGFALANAPYWLAYFAISGVPNYRYSDVIKMANNYQTGGLTKNNSIETSNDLGLKKLTVIDTSVVGLSTAFDALLQRLVFQAFAVHGSHSIGSIWGQTDIYAGSGNVILRCDGGAIDWAFKNAGNCNYVKVSNLDVEVVQCNGSGGNGTLKLGAFNGNIDMYVGTAGIQASGTKVIQVKSTKQVIIGDNNTQANRYDATTKLIIDHTQLTNGIKICKATTGTKTGQTTRIDHNNVNSQSYTFQDNYNMFGQENDLTKTLYTLNGGTELWYWDRKISPAVEQVEKTVGGGITYLITNPTTVSNTSPSIFMTPTYTSTSTTSITKSGYVVGLTYFLVAMKSDYIPMLGNAILSGKYNANMWATYQGSSLANLTTKLYYIGETSHITQQLLIVKNYTGSSGSGAVQAMKTKPIYVPQYEAPSMFLPVIGTATIDLAIITFPSIAIALSSAYVNLRCTLCDNTGAVLYTFGELSGLTAGTSDRSFIAIFSGVPTSITATNLTNFFFQIAITYGTGTISQATAKGANDANYTLGARVKFLLYDGANNTTPLTANSTNLYALTMPVSTCDITEFTTFSKIQCEIYYRQTTGTASNHQISLLFNDGYLSHLHTNITPASSAVSTPTLASVLTTSNSAGGNEIDMNGNAIRGITALIPVSGPSWNVRNLTAGTGTTILNDGAGTYTINADTSSLTTPVWDNNASLPGISIFKAIGFSVPLDIVNYRHEVLINFRLNANPGTWMSMGFNEYYTQNTASSRHYGLTYGIYNGSNSTVLSAIQHYSYSSFAWCETAGDVSIKMIVEANKSMATGNLGVVANGTWDLVNKPGTVSNLSRQEFTKYVYGAPVLPFSGTRKRWTLTRTAAVGTFNFYAGSAIALHFNFRSDRVLMDANNGSVWMGVGVSIYDLHTLPLPTTITVSFDISSWTITYGPNNTEAYFANHLNLTALSQLDNVIAWDGIGSVSSPVVETATLGNINSIGIWTNNQTVISDYTIRTRKISRAF